MELLRKSTNTPTRGSIIVDAAICIPIFIIAIGMILQVINIVGKEENAYYVAETRIQTIGNFESKAEFGTIVDIPNKGIYIDHVQKYPIIKNIKFPFPGASFNRVILSMDMPYRTYIGESPDKYGDQFVYIFPKNEGNEKEGPKYHDKYCRTMKGAVTKGLTVEKVQKNEAESRGYTHCKWCERE